MLDENLPTFRFRPATDDPLSSVLYFTQSGSDASPEYLFRRADPSLPGSRNRYAVALCDPLNPAVVYAEVLVEPEWSQPTLSAAEIRAQTQNGAPPAPATANVPDTFTIQLYNPDQSVAVKMVPGGWNKSDSWEFELPVQTFRQPSASTLDREVTPVDLIPRIMFLWKKDGRLSKDVTCYMSGKSLGGRKSKEPDITVALFKAARDSVLTVYEPNLHRVEVEDRKGLELVLLLGAEVIKELYLTPKMDVFNVQGGAPVAVNGGRRKNSRPTTTSPPPAATMSGAVPSNIIPGPQRQQHPAPPPAYGTMHSTPAYTAMNAAPPAAAGAGPGAGVTNAEIDAETRRLQALVEREEREREKREKAEQKRIKKMLEEEEKERRRKEAEVAKETERLRKKYGVEGQNLPPLPPRNTNTAPQFAPPPAAPAASKIPAPPPHFFKPQNNQLGPGWGAGSPALPPRPVSAGPMSKPRPQAGPFHCSTLNTLWNGPGGNGWGSVIPPPHIVNQQQQHHAQQAHSQAPPRRQGSGGAPYMGDQPVGYGRPGREEDRRKVQKKRSSHW